jgi:2-polyprenyl-3-methyl-5-hydroxy-6-metoxy-1,4-benzoquinol methylase
MSLSIEPFGSPTVPKLNNSHKVSTVRLKYNSRKAITHSGLATQLGLNITNKIRVNTAVFANKPPSYLFEGYSPTGSLQNLPIIAQVIQELTESSEARGERKEGFDLHMSAREGAFKFLSSVVGESNIHLLLNHHQAGFQKGFNIRDKSILLFPQTQRIQEPKVKQEGSIGNLVLHPFILMALEHMSQIDFRGKKVLDFGSGSGVLSLWGLKQDAAHVTCIEKYNLYESHMMNFVRANGLTSEKINYIDKGLSDDATFAQIQEQIPADTSILLANIGNTYGTLDVASLGLALQRCGKNLKHIVMSGYYFPADPEVCTHSLPEVLGLAYSGGFCNFRISETDNDGMQMLSFMASRE